MRKDNEMKETVRTASVLEIYNEAIRTLTEEKRSLQIELKTLQGGDAAKQVAIRGSRILLLVLGAIIQLASALLGSICVISAVSQLVLSEYTLTQGEAVFLFITLLICIGPFFLGRMLFKKGRAIKDPQRVNEARISEIGTRLNEIAATINDRTIRKRSLLEAEEVIVSKDIKTEKATGAPEEKTKTFDASSDSNEKDCPMCAETVKEAARICRYCSYNFE